MEDEERLKLIRSRAKVLIALGACATIGGVNKLKNNFDDLDEVKKCVYGKDAKKPHLATQPTKSVGRSRRCGLQHPRLSPSIAKSSRTSCVRC